MACPIWWSNPPKTGGALRGLYAEQADMRQCLRAGDVAFHDMRETMAGVREGLAAVLSEVLAEAQLDQYEQTAEGVRQSMGQRLRRPRN